MRKGGITYDDDAYRTQKKNTVSDMGKVLHFICLHFKMFSEEYKPK